MRFVTIIRLFSLGLCCACASEAASPDAAAPAPPVASAGPTLPAAGAQPSAAAPQIAVAPAVPVLSTPPVQTASPLPSAAGAPAALGGGAAGGAAPTGVSSTADWCGVKRVLQAQCTVCHNEQKVAGAPMSLKSYADTQAAAFSDKTKRVYELIGMRAHDKQKPMPPQAKLTPEELAGIDAWVAAKAPAGADPECAGSVQEPTTDGWQWPEHCDATYKLLSHGAQGADSPHIVPAGQETHPNVSVPAPWGSQEVQMIAWRALTDNPKVMHHWILYGSSAGREHLVSSSPGKPHNAPMAPDVGMYLPGGTLTLNMHYNNLTGTKDEPDRSGLEVCVVEGANKRPKVATTYPSFTQFAFSIPPKAVDMEVTGTCNVTVTEPVMLISASPHAHKLAHHMRFTVQRAGGEVVSMLDADFDYQEQGTFELKTPVELRTGDKVITTCIYSNPGNTTVTFGENTADEMCFNFATYYPRGALSCGLGGGLFPGR